MLAKRSRKFFRRKSYEIGTRLQVLTSSLVFLESSLLSPLSSRMESNIVPVHEAWKIASCDKNENLIIIAKRMNIIPRMILRRVGRSLTLVPTWISSKNFLPLDFIRQNCNDEWLRYTVLVRDALQRYSQSRVHQDTLHVALASGGTRSMFSTCISCSPDIRNRPIYLNWRPTTERRVRVYLVNKKHIFCFENISVYRLSAILNSPCKHKCFNDDPSLIDRGSKKFCFVFS